MGKVIGQILGTVAAILTVPAALALADRAQRPFRGPVFIDLGAFPGPAPSPTSTAMGLICYGACSAALIALLVRVARAPLTLLVSAEVGLGALVLTWILS